MKTFKDKNIFSFTNRERGGSVRKVDGYIYVATGGDDSINLKYDVLAFDPSKRDLDGSYKIVGKYKVPQFSLVVTFMVLW